MMTRRLFGLALAGLMVARAPLASRAASLDEVSAPIARFQAALLEVMKASATPFAKRYDTLAPVVEQTFALDVILPNCVGPRWSSIAPDQRAALAHVFDQFTVASWVANFSRFNGERFVILPDMRQVGADEIVKTRIESANPENSHRIDYQMRQTPDGWRAVDVLLDGSISRVAVQRSDFRAYLARNSAAPLIEVLRRKIASLSGGSLPS